MFVKWPFLLLCCGGCLRETRQKNTQSNVKIQLIETMMPYRSKQEQGKFTKTGYFKFKFL